MNDKLFHLGFSAFLLLHNSMNRIICCYHMCHECSSKMPSCICGKTHSCSEWFKNAGKERMRKFLVFLSGVSCFKRGERKVFKLLLLEERKWRGRTRDINKIAILRRLTMVCETLNECNMLRKLSWYSMNFTEILVHSLWSLNLLPNLKFVVSRIKLFHTYLLVDYDEKKSTEIEARFEICEVCSFLLFSPVLRTFENCRMILQFWSWNLINLLEFKKPKSSICNYLLYCLLELRFD